jgi:hypothetical protein
LGQIEVRKVYGKLNNADMHTKPFRSSDFAKMAHKILGQPAPSPVTTPTSPPTLLAGNKSASNLGVDNQPSKERKRLWLPAANNISGDAERRKSISIDMWLVPLRIRQRMQM